MILRAMPLALLLCWLAYESHFSPTFFVRTIGVGLASIADGVDEALSSGYTPRAQKIASRND